MANIQDPNELDEQLSKRADAIGNFVVDAFNYVALFAIGAAVVWSAVLSYIEMAVQGGPTIHDILLLFIYLELGAMVGIYFKTQHMPTRFLVYIGITALVRMLIDDVQAEHEATMEIIYIAVAILLLSGAGLVIRYASWKFPSDPPSTPSK